MKYVDGLFKVREKLGLTFTSTGEKIARLTDKMRLGVRYEALMKSELWPVFAALLNSKAEQAVRELKKSALSEKDRIHANIRSELIEEIYHDMDMEIRRAAMAKNELDKIKENENV